MSDPQTLATTALAVAVLAVVVAVVATVRLGRVRAQLRLIEGQRPVGAGDLAALRADIAQALRHVAVVRYDAFGDMGGRLSFSAAVMFLIGGLILIRGARKADEDEAQTEEEFATKGAATAVGLRAIAVSFGVLFLAEWGDLSQLLTASMVVQFKEPVSVFLGAFLALATVSGLAAVLGRALLARVKLATIRRIGGGVCLVLAALTVLQIFEVIAL